MRGGFQHYVTPLDDGKTNRALLEARLRPMLALNGKQGIPQKRTLGTIAEAARS